MASLEQIFMLALITVLAALFTLRRIITWRIIFGYALYIDVAFTVGMVLVFKGTVAGAASATLAGLLLSVALFVGKALAGHSKFTVQRRGLRLRITTTQHPGAAHWLIDGLKAWATNQINAAKERART